MNRHANALVLLSMLFTFVFLMPSYDIKASAVMDSTTQKSVKLPIIMYHSILKNPSKADVYIATPDALRSDLKYLKDHGFETVVVQDLIDYVNGQAALPEKPVMITFDDGQYNVLYYALPILEEMGMRAVVSVVGSYTEAFSINPDPNPNYAYLSWDEVKVLKESGHFEIQNHSYAMHSLSDRQGSRRKKGESEAAYCASFTEDVMKQQMLLQEKCGVTATAFAFPYGFVSSGAQTYLKQMGFAASMTCNEHINYIQAGNPECLFLMGRYNRSGKVSSSTFMRRLMKAME